ncbi:hypothetical protein V7x_00020 [Crateriforma conspicua]|uniref:Uncharacterized protein n=1 Tax=Crateriforma conspicua TaxID=2527996 RepID=A0A5C6FSD0_9PLAN|nr:hypothetical protein V7x_00020 [Crateriforma conspicua]
MPRNTLVEGSWDPSVRRVIRPTFNGRPTWQLDQPRLNPPTEQVLDPLASVTRAIAAWRFVHCDENRGIVSRFRWHIGQFTSVVGRTTDCSQQPIGGNRTDESDVVLMSICMPTQSIFLRDAQTSSSWVTGSPHSAGPCIAAQAALDYPPPGMRQFKRCVNLAGSRVRAFKAPTAEFKVL